MGSNQSYALTTRYLLISGKHNDTCEDFEITKSIINCVQTCKCSQTKLLLKHMYMYLVVHKSNVSVTENERVQMSLILKDQECYFNLNEKQKCVAIVF